MKTDKKSPSGWFEGATHVYPVRVYYQDTDAAGLLYHARYLHFSERARTEMTRLLGFDVMYLAQEKDMVFAIVEANLKYRVAAHLDDELFFRTRIVEIKGASGRIAQRVVRNDNGKETLIAETSLRAAAITQVGKSRRWDDDLKAAMLKYTTEPETGPGS